MRTKREKKKPGLADVLFGKNRGAVLGLLFWNPDKSFYVRQIARTIGASPSAIAPELNLLSNLSLLISSSSGNQRFFQANRSSPVFAEISALVAKTVGVFQLLRAALAPLSDRIAVAFVYGSVAKQQEAADSDVDVMVVGAVDLDEVVERVATVEKQIGRQVNPTLYSVKEFSLKVASGSHFVSSVVRGPKVFIIGDENELRGLGEAEADRRRAD